MMIKNPFQEYLKKLGVIPRTREEIDQSNKVREFDFMREQIWRQSVVSQHNVHATIAGLEISSLTLFIAFYGEPLEILHKVLFCSAIIAIVFEILCLIHMSEHERATAYGKNTKIDNKIEEITRKILNWLTLLSALLIGTLLVYSVLI